jgi:hypothetical protein
MKVVSNLTLTLLQSLKNLLHLANLQVLASLEVISAFLTNKGNVSTAVRALIELLLGLKVLQVETAHNKDFN